MTQRCEKGKEKRQVSKDQGFWDGWCVQTVEVLVGGQDKGVCAMQDLTRSQQKWTRVILMHFQGLVVAVLANACRMVNRINQQTWI